MSILRALTRRYARLALLLVALALTVKALVPAGYMISSAGERFLTVTICADASGAPKQMRIAVPDKEQTGSDHSDKDHSDTGAKGQPCAFSGLGQAALSGADPILLAEVLAFLLLVGLAPLPALPVRQVPFLRPHLRGPPLAIVRPLRSA